MTNDHNKQLGYKIYTCQRKLSAVLEMILSQFDLNAAHWNVLNQLSNFGAMSQKEIAKKTQKDQVSITRYVDTLEKMGLVSRQRQAKDRRSYLVNITDKGETVTKQLEPTTLNANKELINGISQEEIIAFFETIDKINNNCENLLKGDY